MNIADLPFVTPNREEWLVKEYQFLDSLTVLKFEKNMLGKSGLISWRSIDKDLSGLNKEMFQGLCQIKKIAKQEGFNELNITGHRVKNSSSANPVHNVDIKIKLKD